jgi:hypothetical protein
MNSYTKNNQRWAILSQNKKIIKSKREDITNQSGIYMFWRVMEDGGNACYIGQAKNLLERTAQHLMGREQHIDKSLYKRKWWSSNNPFGWNLAILGNYPLEKLDEVEQKYIQLYLDKGWKLYNVTGGGQIDKAKDINERNQVKLKSYKNGKNLGYEKAREEVKVYFNKYLDVIIKGKTDKVKERKLNEFKKFLEM